MFISEQVEEVRRLAAEGKLSDRQIAKRMGMSHTTVKRIRKGYSPGKKYAEQRKEREKKVEEEKQLPRLVNPDSAPFCKSSARVEFVRCLGCGGKVQAQVPCMVCNLRRRQKSIKEFEEFMEDLLRVDSCYPSVGLTRGVDR